MPHPVVSPVDSSFVPDQAAVKGDHITRRFGRSRVVLPVIHVVDFGSKGLRSVKTAVEAGADGVLLIPWGATWGEVSALADLVRDAYPSLPLGINPMGRESVWGDPGYSLVWTDPSYVDLYDTEKDQSLKVPRHFPEKQLWFGGAVFKTQRPVPLQQIPQVARTAGRWIDVPTTSGAGTGVAADEARVRTMREALPPEVPLACASGIRSDNVAAILPYVSAYIVATGIEASVGVLDPAKTRELVRLVHECALPFYGRGAQ